jgi:hypothetical protein
MGKDESGKYALITSYQRIQDPPCYESLCNDCNPNTFQNGSTIVTLWTNHDNPDNPVCMHIEPPSDYGDVYYYEIIYYQDDWRFPIEMPPEKVDYWINQSSTW